MHPKSYPTYCIICAVDLKNNLIKKWRKVYEKPMASDASINLYNDKVIVLHHREVTIYDINDFSVILKINIDFPTKVKYTLNLLPLKNQPASDYIVLRSAAPENVAILNTSNASYAICSDFSRRYLHTVGMACSVLPFVHWD